MCSSDLLGHSAAKYFSVGRVGSDQVSDYAARKGIDEATAARLVGTR